MNSLSRIICLLGVVLLCGQLTGRAVAQDTSSSKAISEEKARQIVTRAYEKILKRPPDPSGMENFTKYLIEEGKDAAWLRTTLKESPEYTERVKHRKQDRVSFSIIAVIVVIVGGILFFPRKKAADAAD